MIRRDRVLLAFALSVTSLSPARASSQQQATKQDTTSRDTTKLAPVVVTVAREAGRSVLKSPFAISVIEPDNARPGQRHTSIDESLALVPGLTSVSRNNPAQDPRISIRGFGARSAFGVRGIRVLRDGMPITMPDGQTPLDYLSVESVGRIEVLRGAASALYGNASGGVIDLQSALPATARVSMRATQWLGSSASSRSVVAASGSSGAASYLADIAYSRTDGQRAHSRQRATSGSARLNLDAGPTDFALTILALDNPLSENPGALTLGEMRADPLQADALSLRRNANKKVKQIQVGASSETRLGRSSLSFSGFGGTRSLDNPLTFGIVEVGRHSHGASVTARTGHNALGVPHSLATGVEYQSQNDLRRNYATCVDTVPQTKPTVLCPFPGADRGIVTLDQRELVSSVGFFVTDAATLTDRVNLSAGLRADRIGFEVKDRLVSASSPDDSGRRTLSAVSPVVGIVAKLANAQSMYANISTAFETPTATELGNHPDGTSGLNPDLDPQRSMTMEAGAKGWIASLLRYDVSVFDTHVRDELVPFEIPGSNGRRYFRNAGRTRRRGAELGANISNGPAVLMLSYTYSHFRFEDYAVSGASFAANEIPGIPAHRLQTAVRISHGPTFVVIEGEAAGRTFVDDANSSRAPGYFTMNARMGWSRNAAPRLSFTLGAQNVFNRKYASSIAVNAARGKYFEPAARRTLFVGISLTGDVH